MLLAMGRAQVVPGPERGRFEAGWQRVFFLEVTSKLVVFRASLLPTSR